MRLHRSLAVLVPIAAEVPRIFECFHRVPGIEVQLGSQIGLGVGLLLAAPLLGIDRAKRTPAIRRMHTQTERNLCKALYMG